MHQIDVEKQSSVTINYRFSAAVSASLKVLGYLNLRIFNPHRSTYALTGWTIFFWQFELIYIKMRTLLGEFAFFNRVNVKYQPNFMEAGQHNGKNET